MFFGSGGVGAGSGGVGADSVHVGVSLAIACVLGSEASCLCW